MPCTGLPNNRCACTAGLVDPFVGDPARRARIRIRSGSAQGRAMVLCCAHRMP